MTVSELIVALSAFDGDDEIVLASDAEGNDHSPLYCVEDGIYAPESREVHPRELTEDDIANGYTEDDLYDGDDGIKAIILIPK